MRTVVSLLTMAISVWVVVGCAWPAACTRETEAEGASLDAVLPLGLGAWPRLQGSQSGQAYVQNGGSEALPVQQWRVARKQTAGDEHAVHVGAVVDASQRWLAVAQINPFRLELLDLSQNGSVAWNTSLGDPEVFVSSPTLAVRAGALFIKTVTPSKPARVVLHCVDMQDGRERWRKTLNSTQASGDVVANEDAGVIYTLSSISASGSALVGLGSPLYASVCCLTLSGEIEWIVRLPDPAFYWNAMALNSEHGMLVVTSSDGWAYGLRLPKTAAALEGLEIGWSQHVPAQNGGIGATSTHGSVVLMATGANTLFCLDVRTGGWLWNETAASFASAATVDAETGEVFVGTQDGMLLALRGDTGMEVWSDSVNANVQSPVVGGNEVVMVGSSGDSLFGYYMVNGRQLWQLALHGSLVMPPIVTNTSLIAVTTKDVTAYSKEYAPLIVRSRGHHHVSVWLIVVIVVWLTLGVVFAVLCIVVTLLRRHKIRTRLLLQTTDDESTPLRVSAVGRRADSVDAVLHGSRSPRS